MRIARVLGRANVGGPARTVIALCRRLRDRGVATRLFVGEPGRGEGDLLEGVTDLDVVRVPELRRRIGPFDLRAVPRLRDRLAEFDPDLVHTHAAKAGVLGRRAALALPRLPRLVHTFHGHVLHGYFPRPVSALFAAIERRLARRTDALIAVSARVREELAVRHRVAPESAFTVIDNGVDLSRFEAPYAEVRRRARLRLEVDDPGVPLVLVPARLVPIKGHELLFAALRRLPASARPLRVDLLGDGPLRADLQRAARSLPDGVDVRFHGFRDDLPEVLPAADCVALPSVNEGQPLALIEAMAAGVPVVATAVGGVPDLVESGRDGLLATPGDAASFAFALARVLTDLELRRSLASAAREKALARHAIERVVDEHLLLYRRLVGGAAPR